MTGCSDQIFVKGYEFLSFARNMGKKIGKNISKNLSDKYSQKPLDHTKQSATENLAENYWWSEINVTV